MARPLGEVSSEFAALAVAIDDTGNGTRLRVEDLRTGHIRYLDALELETLSWLPADTVDRLLDPSRHRWIEAS
jgi:hypothetical protein